MCIRDSITTNENTTLQVNSYLSISRTDSGISTVGDLELVILDEVSNSNSLIITDMNLIVGGTADLDGKEIVLNGGTLSFQGSPSFTNNSSISVSDGELSLENGATFSDTSLNFNSSIFKPSGIVSLTASSSLNFNETSSIQLQGPTTFTQNGTAYWPSIDLNGTMLTLNVTEMYCCVFQSGGLIVRGGESINSGTSNFNVDNPLTIESGGTFTSGSGSVQISGALTLDGELVQPVHQGVYRAIPRIPSSPRTGSHRRPRDELVIMELFCVHHSFVDTLPYLKDGADL